MALNYAFGDNDADKKPVLFVKLVRNFKGFGSIVMNTEAYSSYPNEAEILIMEGALALILGYEEKFEITNKHESMKRFAGK